MSKDKQATGGSATTTPGQVGKGSTHAEVMLSNPKRIDSMGGSENRGRGNHKMGSK